VISAAILQPPDQEQLTVISAAILKPPDQEQLTRDSRRHLSTARSRTTYQRFPPPSVNKHIQNNSPAIRVAIHQQVHPEQLTKSDSRRHSCFNRQIKNN